jgi:dihydroxyacetone kinase
MMVFNFQIQPSGTVVVGDTISAADATSTAECPKGIIMTYYVTKVAKLENARRTTVKQDSA